MFSMHIKMRISCLICTRIAFGHFLCQLAQLRNYSHVIVLSLSNGMLNKYYQSTKKGVRIENVTVDLKTSNVKPIHANWLLSVFDEISKDKHCVIEGFKLADISEVLSD
ncbi:hypothetical protein KUTeg_002103, partial [Tegillarca granosa]